MFDRYSYNRPKGELEEYANKGVSHLVSAVEMGMLATILLYVPNLTPIVSICLYVEAGRQVVRCAQEVRKSSRIGNDPAEIELLLLQQEEEKDSLKKD
jgi:hypothetical protein